MKSCMKNLVNRMDQGNDKISEHEEKVDELKHSE